MTLILLLASLKILFLILQRVAYVNQNPKPIKKGLSNKKWFDCDLKSQKAQLIKKANKMSHNHFDNNIKNSFYKLRRFDNKNRNFKMKHFKQNILKQLDELHNDNPKAYWQLIDKLKDTVDDPPPLIPQDEFLNHLKKTKYSL